MTIQMTKQYISVQVYFRPDGTMLPRALRWTDDKVYKIDQVKQIHPARAFKTCFAADRYTIIMNGRESYLYFEHNSEWGSQQVGRWYVELPEYDMSEC